MLRGYPATTLARRRHLPHASAVKRYGAALLGRNATPTLSVQGMQQTFRRLGRHRAGWSLPTVVRLSVVSVLYGLDLSNAQIAQEPDLNKDELQFMTEHLPRDR